MPYTVADVSAGTLDRTILVTSQPQSSVSLSDMKLKTEPINEDVYAQYKCGLKLEIYP